MRYISAYVIILLGILIIDIAFVAGGYQLSGPESGTSGISTFSPQTVDSDITPVNASIDTVTMPAETPYPEPDYKPSLRSYQIDKNHDIWHAQDPASYITPENEWVRYYASQLYISQDGRIRYKDVKVPWVADKDGNIISWIGKPFLNNYISDDAQFDFPADSDMWVMPDYYLTHGMSDDCDGWAVTVASLLLSGELSVRQGDYFIKQIIPAKVVLGYVDGYRDAWVEYKVYNKTFYTTTALINSGPDGKGKISSTVFAERKNTTATRPVFEFTSKGFGEYHNNTILLN